ncbi:MAG TPA: leucyl/phenylalanyl-tRNA--protein transferase [Bacteriovoracaceae bacterium]|nr:leucyl/phenylalanyl-tRNA--protein transferase [Bacteriovoracaceae bacterium]
MREIVFPPVDTADPDGIVAVGGDFEIDMLMSAYSQGIFPWPVSEKYPRVWFSPDPRGIIDLDEFHLPRSFKKFLKKTPFRATFNQDFEKVIELCSTVERKDQTNTWITDELKEAYIKLFYHQLAYSVEVWNPQGQLVGGLYGVIMGEFVSAESMFMLEDNASKFALYSLCEHFKQTNIAFIDTQMVTSVVELFGGKYIPREVFIKRLQEINWYRDRTETFPD